ncbi:acetylxylan esterase [Rubritalea marina]|uniref:acetylxylan esterase n=1 Tax=Rubritalea marina TaxID=361055 RepID=UPI000380B1DF|nr:acetylxylan esterase [Rubritalea marina]
MEMEQASKRIRPSHRFDLDELLGVKVPAEPAGYAEMWLAWREEALQLSPHPSIEDAGYDQGDWQVFNMSYRSTDDVQIGGWLLLPKSGRVKRGLIVGHGYGGRTEPDFHLPFKDAAILFPCARGIGRSAHPPISDEPRWHVLHDIHKPERYILRGCVEDLWLAVSALLRLKPELEGHIGYLGSSFGGGVGAMALAWENRVQIAHFKVPTFGHQMLRLQLKTMGSGASVQALHKKEPQLVENTLQWFDAAQAAKHIKIPVHVACALADPVVTPPGQFAIYNALAGPKELFTLSAGHMDYPAQEEEEQKLLHGLESFFKDL